MTKKRKSSQRTDNTSKSTKNKQKSTREEYRQQEKILREQRKQELLDKVASYIIENKRVPSRAALLDIGITKDQYRMYFTTIANMLEQVVDTNPEVLEYILTADQIFTQEMVAKVDKAVKSKQRFIITTAVTGMPVHEELYNSMKMYCNIWDAELLILPSTDPAATVPFEMDSILKNDLFVISDVDINRNLKISTFKTSAKQINTLTGLRRIGERERSMIVAATKQFIEYVPVLNSDSNHALISTGALTTPEYLSTDRYMSLRTAWLANQDHELGGIIVEIEDEKFFHFRPFQAAADGSFIDLGTKYSSKDAEDGIRPEAIVLGDIHVGSIDRNVFKTTNQILKELRPKRLFFHDIFDGVSCNPHSSMQNLTKAKINDKLSIEGELTLVGKYLTEMKRRHSYVEEFIVVRSNHDLFLDRYLESGDYIQDPVNFKICHELALKKYNGEIPLEAGLLMLGFDLSKITFLDEDDSYKVEGYECGQHGHRGLNGQRNPGNSSLEIAFGKGIFGHSHTGGKLRKIFRVGTSTRYKLGYNKGASSWTHTLGIVNPDGSAQLVNDISGKWKKVD